MGTSCLASAAGLAALGVLLAYFAALVCHEWQLLHTVVVVSGCASARLPVGPRWAAILGSHDC